MRGIFIVHRYRYRGEKIWRREGGGGVSGGGGGVSRGRDGKRLAYANTPLSPLPHDYIKIRKGEKKMNLYRVTTL